MKRIFVSLLCLLCCLCSFGQKQQLDIQATIANYLIDLEKVEKADSTRLFVIQLQINLYNKIKKTKIFFYNKGFISSVENDTLLVHFNANDLCQYTYDSCLTKQKNKLQMETLILPFIIKNMGEVKDPKREPALNSSNFENIIQLLIHVQKDGGILVKPIILFIGETYY